MSNRLSVSMLCAFVVACGTPPRSTSEVSCGTDTVESDGACVSTLTCGEGTTRDGNACRGTSGETLCGEGTQLEGATCVGTLACGAGTTRSNDTCVASGATVTCGAGTRLSGNQCVPSAQPITCGAGTTQSGNQCVATLSCGAGTYQSGNQCVPGSGTPTAITTFMSTPHVGFYKDTGGVTYDYEVLYTNMDEDQARAYVTVNASPIGGPFDALIVRVGPRGSPPPDNGTWTLAIRAPAACTNTGVRTTPASADDVYVAFVRGVAGSSPTVVCANGGSMTLGRNGTGAFVFRFTTQFSDGTVLTNATFEAEYP